MKLTTMLALTSSVLAQQMYDNTQSDVVVYTKMNFEK